MSIGSPPFKLDGPILYEKNHKGKPFLCYNEPIIFSSFTMIVKPFAGYWIAKEPGIEGI
jgi:hypothetical protein